MASDVSMWHGRTAREMMRTMTIEVRRVMRMGVVRMRARPPALAPLSPTIKLARSQVTPPSRSTLAEHALLSLQAWQGVRQLRFKAGSQLPYRVAEHIDLLYVSWMQDDIVTMCCWPPAETGSRRTSHKGRRRKQRASAAAHLPSVPVEAAVNMLLARVGFDLLRSAAFKQRLHAHIQKKLDVLRIPEYIQSIEVHTSFLIYSLHAFSCDK